MHVASMTTYDLLVIGTLYIGTSLTAIKHHEQPTSLYTSTCTVHVV